MDWLRMVSLVGQLNVVNANTIRAAIERTNYMAVNRVWASRSIKHKTIKHICTDWQKVPHITNGAKLVSLAPELSLATIGDIIPVIEMPENMP